MTYLQYIKLYNLHKGLDPYDYDPHGEEDWDEVEESDFIKWVKDRYGILIDRGHDLINLKTLCCSDNNFNDLEGIEKLTNLKHLDCSNNELTNLNGIDKLTNLKYLKCSSNKLNSLNGIENLTNLEKLYCYNSKLTSLEGIEKLTNLKELDCSYNQLTSLNGIEKLINLKYLVCNNNQLTSLKGIEKLINLKALYCSSNKLNSLNGIENLTNLEKLYCYNSKLTSLEGIEKLTNLKELDCSYNQLTSLKGIENLTNLEELNCFNNNFSNEYKKYLKDLFENRNKSDKFRLIKIDENFDPIGVFPIQTGPSNNIDIRYNPPMFNTNIGSNSMDAIKDFKTELIEDDYFKKNNFKKRKRLKKFKKYVKEGAGFGNVDYRNVTGDATTSGYLNDNQPIGTSNTNISTTLPRGNWLEPTTVIVGFEDFIIKDPYFLKRKYKRNKRIKNNINKNLKKLNKNYKNNS